MKASHWRCKAFGHKAESGGWGVSREIVGYVGWCTRCGDEISAMPTREFLEAESVKPPKREGEARVAENGSVTYE